MRLFQREDECEVQEPRDVLPRYCGRSGERLEIARQDLGFDTQTGTKKYQYWLVCPSAERKDSPYGPGYSLGRIRFVNCEGTRWAEKKESYTCLHDYLDCAPWPKPIRIEEPKPTGRRTAPKA